MTATAIDRSAAIANLSGGGAFNGFGGTANATTSPILSAYLGNNATVDVTGNVTVESTSLTAADGSSIGKSGGIVDVDEAFVHSKVTPTLNTYIGSSASISAGGNITVESLQGPTPVQTTNGTFTPSQVSDDEITFSQDTGLQTGDTVTFSQNGNAPIGGLTDGRDCPVIAVNPTTVQLGVTFNDTDVNTTNDTINFPTPVGLQTGDMVVYEANGTTPVGGLVSGDTYEVLVLTPESIKLVDPAVGIVAPTPFNPATTVSKNTIDLPGFSDGQAVTYSAPAPLGVAPEQISNSTIDLGTDANGNAIPDNFANGDPVVYEPASGATTIGGLKAGKTYYVIALAPNEFQLSTSVKNGVPGAPITLTVPDGAIGLQYFTDQNQKAIGGLVSGNTYYVVNATPTSFQLSKTPGGHAISLNVSHSSGIHTIGVEGIDFTSEGSASSQSLVLVLNPQGGERHVPARRRRRSTRRLVARAATAGRMRSQAAPGAVASRSAALMPRPTPNRRSPPTSAIRPR